MNYSQVSIDNFLERKGEDLVKKAEIDALIRLKNINISTIEHKIMAQSLNLNTKYSST